ncbi:hypothetical protein ACFL96_01460 [Thermoproteota archaeon]
MNGTTGIKNELNPRLFAYIKERYNQLEKKGSDRSLLPLTIGDNEKGLSYLESLGNVARGSIKTAKEHPVYTLLALALLVGGTALASRLLISAFSAGIASGADSGRQLLEKASASSGEYTCGGVTYNEDTICAVDPYTTMDPACINRGCTDAMKNEVAKMQGEIEAAVNAGVDAKNTTTQVAWIGGILIFGLLCCTCGVGGGSVALNVVTSLINGILTFYKSSKAVAKAQEKVHEGDQ